jgi:precorrin-3B synthase
VPTPAAGRPAGPDACPGALRLHAAADGPLARVRVPGGILAGAQLAELHAIAEDFSDRHIELTSRGNLQLRALTKADPAELASRLRSIGLLPSDTHDTVRNILASPMSGRDRRSSLDVRALVPALDRELCAEPRLAALPGRFLFALDDGTGDVAPRADVAAVPAEETAVPAGGPVAILLARTDVGLRVPVGDTVSAMLVAAGAFLDERAAQGATSWRLAELTDGPQRVGARVAAALGLPRLGPTGFTDRVDVAAGAARREPIGLLDQPDGLAAVGALVPLGRLGAVPLTMLERAVTVVVTPWRGVIVPDLPPDAAAGWADALAAAGLETAPASRWVGVTACAGRPGCGKALADVRRDAAAATRAGGADDLPVHWIGCSRGCGSPAGDHVRVEATIDGYVRSVTRVG